MSDCSYLIIIIIPHIDFFLIGLFFNLWQLLSSSQRNSKDKSWCLGSTLEVKLLIKVSQIWGMSRDKWLLVRAVSINTQMFGLIIFSLLCKLSKFQSWLMWPLLLCFNFHFAFHRQMSLHLTKLHHWSLTDQQGLISVWFLRFVFLRRKKFIIRWANHVTGVYLFIVNYLFPHKAQKIRLTFWIIKNIIF